MQNKHRPLAFDNQKIGLREIFTKRQMSLDNV